MTIRKYEAPLSIKQEILAKHDVLQGFLVFIPEFYLKL